MISLRFNGYPDESLSNQYITFERVFFQFYNTGVWKVSFLMVPAFCDQVVAKLDEESCIRKIAREKCTGRFYIAMHCRLERNALTSVPCLSNLLHLFAVGWRRLRQRYKLRRKAQMRNWQLCWGVLWCHWRLLLLCTRNHRKTQIFNWHHWQRRWLHGYWRCSIDNKKHKDCFWLWHWQPNYYPKYLLPNFLPSRHSREKCLLCKRDRKDGLSIFAESVGSPFNSIKTILWWWV